MLIVELKSEALKERHWKTLMRKLHVNWVLSDLNLGQVWDVDLQKNEMIVKDVILVAQGEMALEEFLKQVILLFHPQNWVKCVNVLHGCLVVFVIFCESVKDHYCQHNNYYVLVSSAVPASNNTSDIHLNYAIILARLWYKHDRLVYLIEQNSKF